MPSKKTNTYYGKIQERGVVLFLEAKTVAEKERIYREYLYEPIDKLIENIIRTYKLYRGESYTYEQIHADTLSFLMTKFEKFKPSKGKKSYSYFGTICKNYLIGEIKKDRKRLKNTIDMEVANNELMNNQDYTYYIDRPEINYSDLIEKLVSKLREEVETDDLTDNQFKVGYSLIKILEDWKTIFQDDNEKNSTKLNKNLILFYLREMTGLNTKEIRKSMSRFKTLYYIFKDDYLDS